MELEHGFTVPVPMERAWDVLLDLPAVAPCMPGASLTSHQGDEFTGTVKVKLGPINLTYKGQGRIVERDQPGRRAVIEASGRESRGSGTAKATVTAVLRPDGDATRVDLTTDLTITGRPAQFGRGMMADVGNRLIGQFAQCLSRKLGEGGGAPSRAATEAGTASGAGTEAGTGAGASAPATEPAAVGQQAATGAGAAAPPGHAGPVAQPVAGEPVAAEPVAGAAEPERDVEPIDLLDVTGAGDLTRRVVKYAVAFVAGVLLGWLLSRCGTD